MSVRDYLSMMKTIVQIEPWKSRDSYGEATYGITKTFRARIEMKATLVRDSNGREIAARGKVYVATTTPPDTKDRLTLPAPYTPTNPPILDVMPVQDEKGIHHVVLVIG